ncbi:hypothetical protein L0U85_14280 [Glycomyces sp. L485]|uniref:sucrase ferredoxin n=1 Tax=Glycomyces sp. L485 TaxID=2909235 RepID=UPI001F4B9566|nr:sucrase ferredoxin [Glycomyces sp. L485]MCH7232014.1 hypothetical protein [Glycomyces sp. L485]
MGNGPNRDGCAVVSQAVAEPVFGTAPERAAPWLLVEHAGPWPWRAWPDDVPAEAAAVMDAAEAAGVRVNLVRRVRDRRRDAFTVIAVVPGGPMERRTVADLRELSGLDVGALAVGRSPGFGEVFDEQVVLVCTHGRRDVCCARYGRPVAVQLDRALPGRVWETTHVGGDRFAANVVTMPDGGYHGGVTVAEAEAVAAAIAEGRVVPSMWRGRAGLPQPVQAAEYFLRQRFDIVAAEGLRWSQHHSAGEDGTVCAEFELDGAGRYRVTVRPRGSSEERLTSCAGPGVYGTPTTFDLVALERIDQSTRPAPRLAHHADLVDAAMLRIQRRSYG